MWFWDGANYRKITSEGGGRCFIQHKYTLGPWRSLMAPRAALLPPDPREPLVTFGGGPCVIRASSGKRANFRADLSSITIPVRASSGATQPPQERCRNASCWRSRATIEQIIGSGARWHGTGAHSRDGANTGARSEGAPGGGSGTKAPLSASPSRLDGTPATGRVRILPAPRLLHGASRLVAPLGPIERKR